MNTSILNAIVEQTHGRFVTIEFIKKNGDLRKITGRTGVKYNGVKAEHRMDSTEKAFFLIWSMRDQGFRRISVNDVVSISCDGLVIFNTESAKKISHLG